MARIYLASSWRNDRYPAALAQLRAAGHDVYDFRNPSTAFSWDQVGPSWKEWSVEEYLAALDHPRARNGFAADFNAMNWADTCVMLLPCGRSAHLEAGWFLGKNRRTYFVLADPLDDADLMYLIAPKHCIVRSVDDVLRLLDGHTT